MIEDSILERECGHVILGIGKKARMNLRSCAYLVQKTANLTFTLTFSVFVVLGQPAVSTHYIEKSSRFEENKWTKYGIVFIMYGIYKRKEKEG